MLCLLDMVKEMGAYKYIQKTIQDARKERNETYRRRLSEWRKVGTIVATEVPVNIPRARRLGYRAKKGFVVVRVRIKKGLRKRPKTAGGRSAKHNYRYIQPSFSHQAMAEQKANRRYKNCEVLGSYLLADDGQYKYFEVILADRDHESSRSSSTRRKGKTFRGLTSAGKKARKRMKTKKKSKKKKKK